MSTWQAIFGVDAPVQGRPHEIQRAVTEFEVRREVALAVVRAFDTVNCGGEVSGRLEGPVGQVFGEIAADVAAGLDDLPRVAGLTAQVLDAHLERLRALRSECDEALARARTAWNQRNLLDSQRPHLENLVSSWRRQLEAADPEIHNVGWIESQHLTARSNLDQNVQQAEREQSTLLGIHGRFDSEYVSLRQAEAALDQQTVDALMSIDLGELRDPRWLERFASAVGSFVGGILESVVNLVEAWLTGDWATFFWELKSLLNAALLILGTIALFTGVGTILVILAAAAFAVTVGLYATQTPNPQTGRTVGLGEVLISAVGVMFSAGALRAAFPNGLSGGYQGGPMLFTGGVGSIQTTITNLRHLHNLGMGGERAFRAALGLGITHPTATAPTGFLRTYVVDTTNRYHTARVLWSTRGTVARVQNLTDVTWAPLDALTGARGHTAVAEGSGAHTGFNRSSHEVDGWAIMDGIVTRTWAPGATEGAFGRFGAEQQQGTPVFAPSDHEAATDRVIDQLVGTPEVHLVAAP